MRHNKEDALPRSTTVGASFMNWRGDVALGGNAQVCRSLSFLSAPAHSYADAVQLR